MTYRINIPLSPQEFEALRNVSQSQLRHPRDQARVILRNALLGQSNLASSGNTESVTHASEAGVTLSPTITVS